MLLGVVISTMITLGGIRMEGFHRDDFSLDNGLRVSVLYREDLPTVRFTVAVMSGENCVSPEKSGLARVFAEVLALKTKNRPLGWAYEELENLGGSFSFAVDYEYSSFGFKLALLDSDTFERGVKVVSEALFNPDISSQPLEIVRQKLLMDIKTRQDDLWYQARMKFYELVYSFSHPYGRPITGTEETVKSISVDDLKSFYTNYFRPDNTVVIVYGGVKPDRVRKVLEDYLGRWVKPNRPLAKPSYPKLPPVEKRVKYIPRKGVKQATVRAGHLGVYRTDKNYYDLWVVSFVLGHGFGSRLVDEIREKRGLVYHIVANFYNQGKDRGYFFFAFQTSNEQLEEAWENSVDKVREMEEEGPTDEEIKMAKNYAYGNMPLQIERNLPSFVLNEYIFNLPKNYWLTMPEDIGKLPPDEIRSAAKNYIAPDKLSTVVIYDPSKFNGGKPSFVENN